MEKNVIVMFIICILLSSSLSIATPFRINFSTTTSNINTLYVGGSGPGNYTTIQSAIDDASDMDIVFVYNGVYYENLIVDKSFSLKGENKEYTIIDGDKKTNVVYISANNVQLSSFTIRNSGIGQDYLYNGAIVIASDNNVVENIKCLDTNYGIWASNSDNNTLVNNYIDAFYDGIWLDHCYNNFLRDNTMFNSGLVIDGINSVHDINTSNTVNDKPVYYYYNQTGITVPHDAGQVIFINCSYSMISNLSIYKATDGIGLIGSNYNVIRDNIIHGNTDFAIRLDESNHNIITQNHISNNLIGIALMKGGFKGMEKISDCKYNIITENNIINNIFIGVCLSGAHHNNITNNNFLESKYYHAYFYNSKDNNWSNNYWDNWIGLKCILFQRTPKLIRGARNLFGMSRLKMPLLDFDQNPALEPYAL